MKMLAGISENPEQSLVGRSNFLPSGGGQGMSTLSMLDTTLDSTNTFSKKMIATPKGMVSISEAGQQEVQRVLNGHVAHSKASAGGGKPAGMDTLYGDLGKQIDNNASPGDPLMSSMGGNSRLYGGGDNTLGADLAGDAKAALDNSTVSASADDDAAKDWVLNFLHKTEGGQGRHPATAPAAEGNEDGRLDPLAEDWADTDEHGW